MLELSGVNPAADQNPWGSFFKTISILRIGSGALLLVRHGWEAAWASYHFLWEEKGWDWVKHFNDAGLPYPALLAPAVAIVISAVGLSWCIGFLTRLFSVIFIPIIVGFLMLARNDNTATIEAAWLYLLIAVTLTLFGSGAISLDKLFRIGSNLGSRKKKGW